MAKESNLDAQEAQMDIVNGTKETVVLSSGKKVKIGWIKNFTQDTIDSIIVKYERFKKNIDKDDEEAVMRGNSETRKFYARATAAILLNSYFGITFFHWIKWRIIYYFWDISGDDYFQIVLAAKKKATEAQYSWAMAFLMDMTTLWTTMTKKEAEEYRQELELERKHRSLKNSPNMEGL